MTQRNTSARQSNAELRRKPKRTGGEVAEKSFIVCLVRPYRKPTQVGECKRTQARERDLSKELGINSPVTSGEGVPVARRVSVKWV